MPRPIRLEALDERVLPALLSILPFQAGVFRDGTWFLDTNHDRQLDAGDATFIYGKAGDIPVVGDWNADGHSKVGVFRNVNGVGQFTLDTNGDRVFDAGDTVIYYGLGTDRPIVGDWDGSGRSKVGVVRGNAQGLALYSLDVNGNGVFDAADAVFTYGFASDQVVIGDWNTDYRSKVGVVRNNGSGGAVWTTDRNGDRVFDLGDFVFTFGQATDRMVVGDWNADTQDKVGRVRNDGKGNAQWTLDINNNLTIDPGDPVFIYGKITDVPVVGNW
jgi:hypothetical protein